MVDAITEKTHAELSPSGASRWMVCAGSVELERFYPNSSSVHARWGTVAHELGDICLKDGSNAEDHLGRTFECEGDRIQVDMEMADCVNTYISYVHSFVDVGEGDILMTEEQVPLDHLTGETGATGTSDVIGVANHGKRLVIIDLKGGKGVQVYAENNPQMRMYALGALEKYGMIYDRIEEVQMVIVQPRRNWVDEETIPLAELRAFGEEVALAAGRTQIGNAELVPGEKQCRFCRAKPTCPALKAEVLNRVTGIEPSKFANLDQPTLPKKLAATITTPTDHSDLAEAMRSTGLIEAWIKSVRAEVERLLFDGQGVPGFKLVQGKKGNRQWRDETEALKELTISGRLKVAEATTAKIVSVTTAEKLLKERPKIWAKIAPLITQSEGGPSVASADDPRPEYAVISTADSFAGLSANEALTPETKPAIEEAPVDPFS